MKLFKSSFLSTCLLIYACNLNANEDLGIITIESSTIDIGSSKQKESSSFSYINKEKIDEVTLKNLNDILRTIPGMTLSSRTGEMSQIHIRGVGQQQFMGENSGVAIIIDGVPVMQQAGGVKINLKDIESLKVIKGSASYLYGDTALAGALIITTKKAKDKNSIDLDITFGSHRYQDYLLSLYKSSDDYSLNLNTSYRKTDGYWKDSELWTKSINGKINYFIDDLSDISFSADITDKFDESGARAIVKGVTQAKLNPKGKGNSFSKDNFIDLDKYTLSYTKRFENNSRLLLSTYYYKDLYEKQYNPKDLDKNPNTQDIYTYEMEQNLKQSGIKAEYRIDSDVFASLYGIEYGKRNYESRKDVKANYKEYDRRKKRLVIHHNGENEISEDKEDILGLYSEFKYNLTPKFTTTFNARYDYQKKKLNISEKKFKNSAFFEEFEKNKKSFNNMAYRLGSTYLINDNNSVFSNVSTAFETPDIEDIKSNSNIKEQKSINYELGFRGNNTLFNYETSIFQIDNKDIISPEGGTYSFGDMMDNSGDTRTRGLELFFQSDRSKIISFDMSYTYLDAKYTKFNTFKHTYRNRKTQNFNIVGNKIPRVSSQMLDVFLYLKATEKLTLISELYAKSSYYADETNIIKMPGYGILNVQARYKTKINKKNFEFFVKANNVLDKQYYRAAYLHRDKRGDIGIDKEDTSIVVDPGREFYAGIKYSF